jgi:hypothetical protein
MSDILLTEEKASLSDSISPRSLDESRHVRQLAMSLREKTAATPFAADSLTLSNEVAHLCDDVEQLHRNVRTLLTKIEGTASSGTTMPGGELTAKDKKAAEIQHEIHELHPTATDTIKALFMWRDSPEERLRDDK